MTDGNKDIPIQVSLLGSGWSVAPSGDNAFQLSYTSTGSSTSTGTIIVDKTQLVGADLWNDYMMWGYANLASVKSSDVRIGYVLRYQDSDNYYFTGFNTDVTDGGGLHSTYEVWEKNSGVYSRIPNQFDTGNNDEGSSDYSLPDTVGTDGVLDQDVQYHLRIELYDVVCRMYISNELVYQNTTGFTSFLTGELGIECFTQSNADVIAYFDSIRAVS